MSARRSYRVTIFKTVAGSKESYGAKRAVGDLVWAHRCLVRKYGAHATVRVIGPGKYSVANGAAEMEVVW